MQTKTTAELLHDLHEERSRETMKRLKALEKNQEKDKLDQIDFGSENREKIQKQQQYLKIGINIELEVIKENDEEHLQTHKSKESEIFLYGMQKSLMSENSEQSLFKAEENRVNEGAGSCITNWCQNICQGSRRDRSPNF